MTATDESQDDGGRTHGPAGLQVRRVSTDQLSAADLNAIRRLLDAAFADDEDGFVDDDWEHARGGLHFVAELDGAIVAHASVVERDLRVGGVPVRTGYVEAVATAPSHQGAGIGSLVMREVNEHIRARYEMGALGTGRHRFYQRLGWRTWLGPSAVRTGGGVERTPEDDGYILVLDTSKPSIDLAAPISCEWRPGDVW